MRGLTEHDDASGIADPRSAGAFGSVGPDASVAELDSLAASSSFAEDDDRARDAPGDARRDGGCEASRFRVGDEIGAGGMGRVSLAHDQRLLRDVAWKRGDWRLLREARILAQLEHPGIVPLYDMGFDLAGEPWFAMRVVRGRSLAEVLRETPADARLDLLRPLLQVAEAVAYAHHRGVIHRDLKPANIMIGQFGEIQVVDWGLARVLDEAAEPLPTTARRALTGQDLGRVGTPGFMSPEQSRGEPADRRSDVFGLGRVLERILAGLPDAPPELHAVAARCTAPAPADRYADAGALAAELAAFLAGRRVSAYAYRRSELLRRFARVHRLPLAIIAVGLTILIAVGVVYVSDVAHERELAESSAHETSLALERSDRHLARSLVGEARRLLALGASPEAGLLAAHAATLVDDPDARGLLASIAGTPSLTVTERRVLPCDDAQVDPLSLRVLCSDGAGLDLWDMAASPARHLWRRDIPVRVARLVDGGVAVAASASYQITLLDLDGNELIRGTAPNNATRRTGVAGARAVFESSITSIVIDISARSIEPVMMCDGDLHASYLLSPDPATDGGDFQLILCRDGRLRFPDGRVLPTELIAPEREGLKMARAGDFIVVGTTKGEVIVLDREGRELRSSRAVVGMVRVLAPSPDARLLAVAGEGDPVLLLSLPELAVVGAFPRRVKSVQWHPARSALALSVGHWLEHWQVSAGMPGRPLGGAYLLPLADGVVALDADPSAPDRVAVAFGPFIGRLSPDAWVERHAGFVTTKGVAFDGRELLALGVQGLHTYDAITLAPHSLAGWPTGRRLAALDDGTVLAGLYGAVRRGSGRDGDLEVVAGEAPLDIAVSPDRHYGLVLLEPDRSFWRATSGEPGLVPIGGDPHAEAAALGPGGATVYAAHRGEVAIWDDEGALVRVLNAGDAALAEVAVSPDGAWVAAGGLDGGTWVWHATETEPRARFHDHLERVPALAFSPDGHWLLTGSWDRTLRVRDLAVLDTPAARLEAELAGRYHLDLGEALGSTDP